MSEDDLLLIPEFRCTPGVSSAPPPPPGYAQLNAAAEWSPPDGVTCGGPPALDIAMPTAYGDGTAAGPAEAVDAEFASPRPAAWINAVTAAPAAALRLIDGTFPPVVTTTRPDSPMGFPTLVSPAFANTSSGSFALESPLGFDCEIVGRAETIKSLPVSPSLSVRSFGGLWPADPRLTAPAVSPGPFYGAQISSPLAARGGPAELGAFYLAPSEPPFSLGSCSVAPDATRHASPDYFVRPPGSPAGLRADTALLGEIGPYYFGQSMSAPTSPLFCGSPNAVPDDTSVPGSPVTTCGTPRESLLLRETFSSAGLPRSPTLQPCPGPERDPATSGKKTPVPAKSAKKTPGPKALASEGRKPHPCRIPGCQKGFKRPEHLKRHTRTVHWGERPFDCPKCRKPFSRLDNMLTHAKLHEAKARKDEAASASSPLGAAKGEQAAAPNVRHFAPPAAGPGLQPSQFFALGVPFSAPPPEADTAMLQATLAHLAFRDSDAF